MKIIKLVLKKTKQYLQQNNNNNNMESFTLNNLKRDEKQEKLYNIFKQTYVDSKKLKLMTTYVNFEENMRLDKISYRLYGSTVYIEELMQINNIINVWNVKYGDQIQYAALNSLHILKSLEKELDDVYEKISKENKNTRVDPNRSTGVPPTIKPKNLENLTIDKKTRKIKINGNIS